VDFSEEALFKTVFSLDSTRRSQVIIQSKQIWLVTLT